MRKYIIFLAALAAGAALSVSCMDNRSQYLPDDRVYIPNSGPTVLTVYNLNDSEVSMPVRATKGGVMKGAATVWFSVDESLLREYNDGQLFAEDHVSLLPSDCFRFDADHEFDLTGQMDGAAMELFYTPSKIASYSYGRKYALPIRLHSNGVEVNSERDNMIVIFDLIEPTVYLTPLTVNMQPNWHINTGTSAHIRATVDFVADEDYDVELVVGGRNGVSAADEVAAYNTANGTAYTLLPQANYAMSSLALTLEAGSSEVTSTISLIMTDDLVDGEYMVPVTLVSAGKADGTPLKIVETQSTGYFRITVSRRVWILEAAEKTEFAGINCRSMTTDAVSTGGYAHDFPILFDGVISQYNYMGVKWSQDNLFETNPKAISENKPQWWVIDLGKVYNLTGVRLDARGPEGNFNTLASARVYISETAPTGDPVAGTGIYTPLVSNAFPGTYSPIVDDATVWGSSVGSIVELSRVQTPRTALLTLPTPTRYVLLWFYAGGDNLALSEFGIQHLPED